MATNTPTGDNARKGAVRKRTQLRAKVMGESTWTKRNKKTGDSICVNEFSMQPTAVYAGRPVDFDTADWRDDGRELDCMLWLEGDGRRHLDEAQQEDGQVHGSEEGAREEEVQGGPSREEGGLIVPATEALDLQTVTRPLR